MIPSERQNKNSEQSLRPFSEICTPVPPSLRI
jgi:hypothetical protein